MIIQKTLNGEIVAEYTTKAQAAKVIGCNESSIRRAISQNRTVAGKFKFSYSDSVSAKETPVLQSPAKVLILDIETAPLRSYTWGLWKQNVGLNQIISDYYIISWAAKYLGEDEVFSDVLTSEEAIYEDDKRIMLNLWKYLDDCDVVIAHNGCVARGNKVLKSDFTWVNVEDLKEGDVLMAFEENAPGNNKPRKYRTSVVEKTVPIMRECSEIEFEDGFKLIATNDHPWLTHYSETQKHWKYVNTEDLDKIGFVTTVLTPWEKDVNQYHAGYLAGFFDADGCLSQHQRRGREMGFTFSLSFGQKDEKIIEKLKESLDFFNFKYSIVSYDTKHSDIKRISIVGGIDEKLRFLGTVCPQKLSRLDIEKFSQLKLCSSGHRKIKKITPIGLHEVIGLQTSSSTYIVEGMPCHNTKFDIPKINTRFVLHNIMPPSPYKQIDTLLTARNIFGFTSNRLDYLATFFGFHGKEVTDFTLWESCMIGDKTALGYMVLYNRNDVVILEKVYLKLRPFMRNHPNITLYIDEAEMSCPHCGSKHINPIEGKYFMTQAVRYQAYRCDDCKSISRSKQGLKYTNKKQISAIPR